MELHPNWVSLSTVDFEKRIFLHEGTYKTDDEAPKNNKTQVTSEINGEDAKNFYHEVLSAPESMKSIDIDNSIKFTNHDRNLTYESDNSSEVCSSKIIQAFLTAAQNNDTKSLNGILKKHSYVLNYTDNFGWTALMCAVQAHSLNAIKFLISKDANITIRDKSGKSALDLAVANNIPSNLFISKKTLSNNVKQKNINEHSESDGTIQCEICGESYKRKEKKTHLNSTIHIFCISKNTKHKTIYGIPESNRGYQLLLKKGWDREKGLGPSGSGNKFPVKTVYKLDKHGFGNTVGVARVTHNKRDIEKEKTDSTLNKRQRKKQLDREKIIEKNIRLALSDL